MPHYATINLQFQSSIWPSKVHIYFPKHVVMIFCPWLWLSSGVNLYRACSGSFYTSPSSQTLSVIFVVWWCCGSLRQMLVATSGRTDVSVGKMCFLIYGLLHSMGYFKVGRTIWIQSGIEFTVCHNCWAWRHPEKSPFFFSEDRISHIYVVVDKSFFILLFWVCSPAVAMWTEDGLCHFTACCWHE